MKYLDAILSMKTGVVKKAANVIKASEIETKFIKLLKSPRSIYEILIHALIASSKQDVYRNETIISLY